jgi:hypothetical protein
LNLTLLPDLWANGFSACTQPEQRVPDGLIDEDGGSLRLIELDEMVLHAGPKAPDFGDMKPIVGSFNYRGQPANWTSPIRV